MQLLFDLDVPNPHHLEGFPRSQSPTGNAFIESPTQCLTGASSP
ncbi:hypothetical protein [Nostoc sp. NOS(2021)]|nr:hypothetical protein [Nostoc sp. NOS(2021)]